MRLIRVLLPTVLLTSMCVAQRVFEVVSVKTAQRQAGPDYNNQLTFLPDGLIAKNATLRRLISQAYELQLRQVSGPEWLDRDEYQVEARAGHAVTPADIDLLLRTVLAQRFRLTQHAETRAMQVYELVVAGTGPKVQPAAAGESVSREPGLRFRGDMRGFADFLAVQLSIPAVDDPTQPAIAGGPAVPVIDKTKLTGVYDFNAELKPEAGVPVFTLWQRALIERFGLRLESRKAPVAVLVVDSAERVPTPN